MRSKFHYYHQERVCITLIPHVYKHKKQIEGVKLEHREGIFYLKGNS